MVKDTLHDVERYYASSVSNLQLNIFKNNSCMLPYSFMTGKKKHIPRESHKTKHILVLKLNAVWLIAQDFIKD